MTVGFFEVIKKDMFVFNALKSIGAGISLH
jgi:hypothetical protein